MKTEYRQAVDAWHERCHDAIDLMRDDPAAGRHAGLIMAADAQRVDGPLFLLISQLVVPFADYYQALFDPATIEFERLAACFEELDEQRGLALCLFGLLIIKRSRGDTSGAYQLGHQRLLPALGGNMSREAILSLNALGIVAQEMGLTDEAIRHFYTSLDMARVLNLPERIAQVTANIGEVFYASGNAEDAETLLSEAKQLAVMSKERWLAPFICTLLALCKLSSDKYEEAYEAIAEYVIDVETGVVSDVTNRAFCLSVFAYTLSMRDDLDRADELNKIAMSLLDQFEEKQLKPYSWWVCGHLHRRRGREEEAIVALNRAIDDIGDIGYVFMPLRAMKELTEIHAQRGDWQTAYAEQVRYEALFKRSQGQATRVRLQNLHIQGELKAAELARRHAEETSKAKSMFLANMSHEIRTPMNAIIGMAHLALRSEVQPQNRDYIEKIHSAGISLLGIINDILDFSKIEAGKLDMENISFDIDDVMAHVSTITSGKACERGLEYLVHSATDIPGDLIGDPLRLGQVLINLVNNAIKFTESGEVYISCHQLEHEGDSVKLQFMVCDTGIGMNKTQAADLFQPFSQADLSTTRKYGGTGLGLTISKRLVELMGGTIWLETQVDIGTAVYFTAWFGIKPSPQQQSRYRLPQRVNGMRILIAEHNKIARTAMTDGLSKLPVSVDVTGNGRDALAAIRRADRSRPFGVVFADATMTGLDGVALIAAIKADRSLVSPPRVVLVSPPGHNEAHYRAIGVRADAVLPRPLHVSMLVNVLIFLFAGTRTLPASRVAETLPRFDKLSVLLVEDNAINQQIAQELMRRAGITVDIAANGRLAVDALHEHDPKHFGLVLMDIQMPEMDGLDASRLIREDARFNHLPIVAMTAHAMAADRQRSLEAGMNDHLTKPINPAELYHAIARWCPAHISSGETTRSADETGGAGEEDLVIPGLDVRAGLHRTMGNRALYVELLMRFRDDQLHTIARLHAAIEKGDTVSAERIAHTLKGSAGLIGSAAIQSLAGELETACHRGAKAHVVQALVGRLERELNSLLQNLQACAATANSPMKNAQVTP